MTTDSTSTSDATGGGTTTATSTDQTDTSKQPDTGGNGSGEVKDWKIEAEKWKDLSRKHEDRAKSNATAAKELEALRQASMSDQDKAVALARTEASAETAKKMAGRLVDAEIKAAAKGRKVDVDALLEGLDRNRFVSDDGEPDIKAIGAWVDRVAPKGAGSGPDLGQGARGSSGGVDMNELIRDRMR